MTAEEIGKIAETHPDAVLIGAEDERDRYYPAIVAFDENAGRFVYDYQMLVEAFADGFKGSEEPYGKVLEEAVEWVDYNVVRSLPYYGDRAPLVLYVDEDSDDVVDACTSETADGRIAKLYKEGMNAHEV